MQNNAQCTQLSPLSVPIRRLRAVWLYRDGIPVHRRPDRIYRLKWGALCAVLLLRSALTTGIPLSPSLRLSCNECLRQINMITVGKDHPHCDKSCCNNEWLRRASLIWPHPLPSQRLDQSHRHLHRRRRHLHLSLWSVSQPGRLNLCSHFVPDQTPLTLCQSVTNASTI